MHYDVLGIAIVKSTGRNVTVTSVRQNPGDDVMFICKGLDFNYAFREESQKCNSNQRGLNLVVGMIHG